MEPVPFFQRPNVRQTFVLSAIVIGVGYVISKVAVVSKEEKAEVRPSDVRHATAVSFGTPLTPLRRC